jgi:hypothetical protein
MNEQTDRAIVADDIEVINASNDAGALDAHYTLGDCEGGDEGDLG